MRGEPSERAEMVSQLIFGDAYTIEQKQDQWLQVRTCDCDYLGWISAKMHNPISEEDAIQYLDAPHYVVKDYLLIIKTIENQIAFPIFKGSSFAYPTDGILTMGKSIFKIDLPEEKSAAPAVGLSSKQAELMEFAASYLQTPYLWGGRTPAGIDCSGFSQIVYKSIGIGLPRDASQQVNCGTTVDFVDEAEAGDLAFFQNEEGRIVHVGIICGDREIIHASGRVKIDTIDSTGIFSKEESKYTHNLRIIKRIL